MQKFFLFAFFGALVYLINIGFTYFQVNNLEFSESVGYLVSLIISALLSFVFSLNYTFKKQFSLGILKRYSILLICFSAVNYTIVNYLNFLFPEKYFYIYIFGATTGIFFLKFFIYDKFVFNSIN